MLYLSDRIISGSFADSLLKWIPSTLRASISYPLEEMTVRSLEQTEAWRRWRLFDEISERSNLSLFCVGLSSEHFALIAATSIDSSAVKTPGRRLGLAGREGSVAVDRRARL